LNFGERIPRQLAAGLANKTLKKSLTEPDSSPPDYRDAARSFN